MSGSSSFATDANNYLRVIHNSVHRHDELACRMEACAPTFSTLSAQELIALPASALPASSCRTTSTHTGTSFTEDVARFRAAQSRRAPPRIRNAALASSTDYGQQIDAAAPGRGSPS
eukprot:6189851-Pleurochrysis_carterae.AAC.2